MSILYILSSLVPFTILENISHEGDTLGKGMYFKYYLWELKEFIGIKENNLHTCYWKALANHRFVKIEWNLI